MTMTTKYEPITGEAQPLTITAAASTDGDGDAKPGRPKIDARSYGGGKMRVGGYRYPVVFDLEHSRGVNGASHPIYRDHAANRIVGHGVSKVEANERGELYLRTVGKLSNVNADTAEIEQLAAEEFPWQASIGAAPDSASLIKAGKSRIVNGREQHGPFYHIVGELGEVSVVPRGADSSTRTAIAATKEMTAMDEQNETPETNSNIEAQPSPLAAIKAERQRRDAIESKAAELIKGGYDLDFIEASLTAAIDGNLTPQGFELEVLRNNKRDVAIRSASSQTGLQGKQREQAVEAALLKEMGYSASELEKAYDERVLNAMDRDAELRRGLGLQDLLCYAAESNGQRVPSRRDPHAMLQAAFAPIEARGSSTFDLSGVLSNVANKSIRQYFMSVTDLMSCSGGEGRQAYSTIGSVASVQDFKQVTRYSLTGDMTYEQVGPSGELKHGTVGEQSYTNQADTYGKLFAISRTDLINDDLGAFNQIGRRLGRGAALKLSAVFWAAFFDDAAFFTAGNANYFDGGSTNLTIDSITTAEKMFLEQTDPDGLPLNVMPSMLLVPPAESANAASLMSSQHIVYGGTSSKSRNNPHANKFGAWTSPYMSNASYGNSDLAWHLLADPMDMPVIETVFLNGRQTPIIEQTQADFDVLGVKFRGYHDFGCALQEHRGGVKSKGEA
jgi:hypothetical protein